MTSEEPRDLETIVRYLKTLADQTRLRLLGLLATEKRSVEELAALLDLKPSTVSWHLNKLKELDLVRMRADGNTHIYSLNTKGLGRVNTLLMEPERVATIAQDDESAWERKVLRDFLEEGKLREIPAYRKKRDVILKWLVDQFTTGQTYTEAEVNDIIKRYHPDSATLRRELVGAALMGREHGVYWRVGQSPERPADPASA